MFKIFRTAVNNTKRDSSAHSTVSIARTSEVCRAAFLYYREVSKVQQQGGWDKACKSNTYFVTKQGTCTNSPTDIMCINTESHDGKILHHTAILSRLLKHPKMSDVTSMKMT